MDCKHHINELMVGAAFKEIFGDTSAPDVTLFKQHLNSLDLSDLKLPEIPQALKKDVADLLADLPSSIAAWSLTWWLHLQGVPRVGKSLPWWLSTLLLVMHSKTCPPPTYPPKEHLHWPHLSTRRSLPMQKATRSSYL